MAEARQRDAWERHSVLLALIDRVGSMGQAELDIRKWNLFEKKGSEEARKPQMVLSRQDMQRLFCGETTEERRARMGKAKKGGVKS